MPMKKYISLLCLLFVIALTTTAYDYSGPEAQLVQLINAERDANSIPPLNLDWELTRLARLKAEEMKTYKLFDHESLIYGSPSQLLDYYLIPYAKAGANIAMGQETPSDVLLAWCQSASHRANLVDECYTSVGVGFCWDDEGIPYWTLILVAKDQESQ